MKKKYIAPELRFESFVLSQSIAAGCGELGIGTVKAVMELGYFYESTPSNYANYICTDIIGDGVYEGYCYWSGSDSTLFLS